MSRTTHDATAGPTGVLSDFPSREEAVLADLVERRAVEFPERTYAVFPDRSWTFAETARRAWRFGHALLREGVAPGESVSVWCPVGPAVLQAWFGAAAVGGVYAPLNLASRGSFLQHALRLAGPRVLVAHCGLLERLVGLEVPTLETIVVVGGEPPDLDLPQRIVPIEEFLAGVPEHRPVLEAPTEPWDDGAIIYTSGTTGPSKGVQLSHACHRFYADCLVHPVIGADDRMLMSLPMSHVGGTASSIAMLQRGGSIVLSGPFDAKLFWDEVDRYRATATFVIHGMVSFLLAQPPDDGDRHHPLRYAYMGPLARVSEFSRRFAVDVYTGFTMTEAPMVTMSGLNPTRETSVGRPFNPDYEVRLVDEHDIPVPPGEPGELIVRHRQPWFMNSGYKDMPEATARAWRNGWFHTGDQLRVDDDGDWSFVDRTKDAIRRRGENISSYEVEAEVLTHPAVDQVAAVAVPNPDLDEATGDQEVKVVVVPVGGRSVDPSDLIAHLVPRMPRHMVPRFVEVVDELPRTPSYKIMKSELRARGVGRSTWDRERAGVRLRREEPSARDPRGDGEHSEV